jgi:hypothetical protein
VALGLLFERAVVGAHACDMRDLPLHQDPIGRYLPRSSIQDHRRVAPAHAVNVQAVAPDVDHLTGRRIGSLGTLRSMAWEIAPTTARAKRAPTNQRSVLPSLPGFRACAEGLFSEVRNPVAVRRPPDASWV